MKVLVIGGTRFIGVQVVKQLLDNRHEVLLFHKGSANAVEDPRATCIHGQKEEILNYRAAFKAFGPDVVLDMVPLNRKDMEGTLAAVKPVAKRIVMISSQDVYRAFGVMNNIEAQALESLPVTENSPLRTVLHMYAKKYPLAKPYEKIEAERCLLDDPDCEGTILRLPMVYGPGDYFHRYYTFILPMLDRRPHLVIPKDYASWQDSVGYVENVAYAIYLSLIRPAKSGSIYNVADHGARTQRQVIETIAKIIDWHGVIIEHPSFSRMADPNDETNYNQNFIVDTSKIRNELGYNELFDFEEAMRRTIDWESRSAHSNTEEIRQSYQETDRLAADHRTQN